MKKTVYYFSGTHWDREWYIPYQEFRMKLVGVVDRLLEILEQDPEFGVFHFDGQTIVLEDYLEIRPENRERLAEQIRQGRIVIGPWYCQPDEFLVSGESLVRNFLIGEEICHRFGVEPWDVGYVPDIFGHIAQFPQLLASIGAKGAMLSRGVEPDTPPFFLWRAPSGDTVPVYRFRQEGGYGSFCTRVTGRNTSGEERTGDDPVFGQMAKAYLDELFARTHVPFAVAADSMDHEPPHRFTSAYVARLQELYPDGEVRHVNVGEMFERLAEYRESLPVYEGELCTSSKDGGMPTIWHTLSSRIGLKQQNNRCEALLEKKVEPLLVYARSRGVDFPESYRKLAWKSLVQNHPHDSICGCSRDQVHQDMLYRFSQTEGIGKALMTEITDRLAGGRHLFGSEGGWLNLFNPFPYRRRETVVVDIPFKPDFPSFHEPFCYEDIHKFRLFTADGTEVPYAIRRIEKDRVFILYGETWCKADYYTVAVDVELEPLGFTALRLEADQKAVRFFGTNLYRDGRLENAYCTVSVLPDGTVELLHKATGRRYTRLLSLVDDGEIGDGWNSVRPRASSQFTGGTLQGIEVVCNTPDYAEICLHRELTVPKTLRRTDNGFFRSEERVSLPVKVFLSLGREEESVRVVLELENRAEDHRLRLGVPTGCTGGSYEVNQAFTVLTRSVGRDPATVDWVEADSAEKNMHGIALMRGEDGSGLAFVGQYGFYECAAEGDTLLLTLLRSFGRVYYDDRLVTAQEQGVYRYTFRLVPLSAAVDNVTLQRMQDSLQSPVLALPHNESLQGEPLLELEGAVCVSALKPAEDGSGDVVLRLYNPTPETTAIGVAGKVGRVTGCTLLEKGHTAPPAVIAPYTIVTLRIQLEEGHGGC